MKRKYFFLLVAGMAVFCFLGRASAEMSKQEAIVKFVKADAYYKNDEYTKAIQSYQAILDSGKESGPVYYNLGNSYFRRGERGRAILNYLRAQKFMPRDSDVRFNLAYARQSLPQYLQKEAGFIEKLMRRHVDFYSAEEMVLIITVLVILLGFGFLGFLYFRWPEKACRPIGFFLGALLLIYSYGLILEFQQTQGHAIIITDTKARFEPKPDATEHFPLIEGEDVRVVGTEGKWNKVERPDGKLGWVEKSRMEDI